VYPAQDMNFSRKRKDCDLKMPPQNEWDFSADRVEKRELPWCFRYEYARNSDSFLERTVRWRKEHKGGDETFCRSYSRTEAIRRVRIGG